MATLDTTIDFDDTGLDLPMRSWGGMTDHNVSVSKTLNGLVEARENSPAYYRNLNVSWRFNAADVATFETFYVDTLGNGSAYFKIELRYPLKSALTDWVAKFSDNLAISSLSQEVMEVTTSLQLFAPVAINDRAFLSESDVGDSRDSMESYSTPQVLPALPARSGGTGWETDWVVTYA